MKGKNKKQEPKQGDFYSYSALHQLSVLSMQTSGVFLQRYCWLINEISYCWLGL